MRRSWASISDSSEVFWRSEGAASLKPNAAERSLQLGVAMIMRTEAVIWAASFVSFWVLGSFMGRSRMNRISQFK